ncbi:MAG TPA: L,D-transpeptidase family protein [Candidatus Polarisedimenticolia bacterium]|nr:L,D-transpeptidase family protein [Candidatus Polarisedimenticolia bacterium]
MGARAWAAPPALALLAALVLAGPGRGGPVSAEAIRAAAAGESRGFYAARGFLPAWQGPAGRRAAVALERRIAGAAADGLDPADYPLRPLRDEPDPSRRDVLLTGLFLRYARHLAEGRITPRQAGIHWGAGGGKPGLAAALAHALREGSIDDTLDRLAPGGEEYAALREALAGEPPGSARAMALRINMDRWRWSRRDLGRRHLLVNIPGLDLEERDGGQVVRRMKVMVGTPASPTPVISSRVVSVALNPAWSIPEPTARRDILPLARRDPELLRERGIRVWRGPGARGEIQPEAVDWEAIGDGPLPYRFTQAAGQHNPLGRIKFLFPNRFNLLLHDTPMGHLFSERDRDVSAGCIRLERPIELAASLLAADGWTGESLERAIAEGDTSTLELSEPVPVHLVYLTVRPDAAGGIVELPDVYGHDERHVRALRRQQVRPAGSLPPGR